MTKPNSSLIVAILDRSGSMSSIQSDMIGGFNTFLAEQKKNTGDVKMTLVRFDDQYEVVHALSDIHAVPDLDKESFSPRGWTALYDAICRTIDDVGTRLAMLPGDERPAKVLVMIVTDGIENASKEYRAENVKHRITTQKEKFQWEFMFLGANQDAIMTAKDMGISGIHAMNYNASAGGVGNMLRAACSNTAAYLSNSSAMSLDSFTEEQRTAAVEEK